MPVEAQILGGEEGALHVRGNGGEGNAYAILRADDSGDAYAVSVINRAGLRDVHDFLNI